MSIWTHTSVRKAQGKRDHRGEEIIRDKGRIEQQKLNRERNKLRRKLRLKAAKKIQGTGARHTTIRA